MASHPFVHLSSQQQRRRGRRGSAASSSGSSSSPLSVQSRTPNVPLDEGWLTPTQGASTPTEYIVHQPVLVFDLDRTLIGNNIPPELTLSSYDTYDNAPAGSAPSSHVIPQMYIYEQIQDLLKTFESYPKCIASFNMAAFHVLRNAGLNTYFDLIVGCSPVNGLGHIVPRGKVYLLGMLASMLGVSASNFIFFDDDPTNVQDARDAGIVAVHVDSEIGVTVSQVQQGIHEWLQRQRYNLYQQ